MNFEKLYKSIENDNFCKRVGFVTDVKGELVVGYLPGARVGAICEVTRKTGDPLRAEVLGIKENKAVLMCYQSPRGIGLDSNIILLQRQDSYKVGPNFLGRVINGYGIPIDGKGSISFSKNIKENEKSISPLDREFINEPLDFGIKAINSFISVGKGQRISIMAGSGVGKSTLMGMMARSSSADVNIIALIGERGREVQEFIHESLGDEGLARSVVVAVTSNESALLRRRGAFLANYLAEYFAEDNKDVLLISDSVTRFAMAQRELGLSAGEMPASRGYTPNLYPSLSKLLEKAGNFKNSGSITGVYTVLVEGDDIDDPVSDTVRSIVDGHVVLSRELADSGQYPPIDVLKSLSRVMNKIVDPQRVEIARRLRRYLALYRESEDLIQIGAYEEGSDVDIDIAIKVNKALKEFFMQKTNEPVDMESSFNEIESIYFRNCES